MARPTAHVLTLLELLQSGGTRTTAELAERLGQGTAGQIRARLPASVATVTDVAAVTEPPCDEASASKAGGAPEAGGGAASAPWLRVDLRAEELHWLPPLLASLDLPFVIDRPAELRDLVAAPAARLAASAARTGRPGNGRPGNARPGPG